MTDTPTPITADPTATPSQPSGADPVNPESSPAATPTAPEDPRVAELESTVSSLSSRVSSLESTVSSLTSRIGTLEARPSSSSAKIVAFTHHDVPSDSDVTWMGVVVERIPAGTDDPEAPERACVAWFHGGVSGPIDTTELTPV